MRFQAVRFLDLLKLQQKWLQRTNSISHDDISNNNNKVMNTEVVFRKKGEY